MRPFASDLALVTFLGSLRRVALFRDPIVISFDCASSASFESLTISISVLVSPWYVSMLPLHASCDGLDPLRLQFDTL